MKKIIDDYSPLLEGVSEEELKEKVRQKPELLKINQSKTFSILTIHPRGKTFLSENNSSLTS